MDIKTEKLMNVSLFEGYGREEIAQLLQQMPYRLRKKSKGEHIAYEEDELTDLLVLVEGKVHTTMVHNDGSEVVVDVIDGPFILAPASVYAFDHHYPVNIIAETDCLLMYINGTKFSDMMHTHKQIMMNFIIIQSERIHFLSKRLREFALLSLKERVLYHMLKDDEPIKNVGLLARRLSVSRSSLSRVLSELKGEGIVERTLNGIELWKEE